MSNSSLLEGNQAIEELKARVDGNVYLPGDAGYEPEIAGFNTSVVHAPEIVVAAESAQDVATAIRYASANGLKITVQATGHGACKPIRDGVLVSTKRLTHVSVDPETRIATIAGGAQWASVLEAGAPHGLAPITGSSATVGAVGYLLGGGLGPLARSHGFSADYIQGFTVVTGQGEIVEASREAHADLFWALRGGKKGLGIVTEVRLRLAELSMLYGGALLFGEDHMETALRHWTDWTKTAHPQVTSSVAMVNFPPFEFIPEPLRGRRILAMRFAYPGDLEEGARLAQPLRDCAPVYMDLLGALPASQVGRIHSDPENPAPMWVTGMLLKDADQDLASTVLGQVGPGTQSPFMVAEIRHVGGASACDTEDGSAVGGRCARYTLVYVSMAQPLFADVLPGIADGYRAAVAQWIADETNINFVGEHRTEECIATAWPANTAKRLDEVRRKYDASEVFG